MLLTTTAWGFAETVGPVTDELGVVKIEKGQPIVLGAYVALSGADFTPGVYESRGMQIAIKDANESLLDHPLELILEDAPCTPEGGQIAATKLSTHSEILAALGPSCSSSAAVGVPILWNVGIPTVGPGPSSPTLTAPGRPEGLNGFVRVLPNSIVESQVTLKYVQDVLKAKTVATIHDGSNFVEQYVIAFNDAYEGAGGKVLAKEAISPADTDLRPVLTRIATNPPEVLLAPVYPAGVAFIAEQMKSVPALKDTVLLASGTIAGADFLESAGNNAVGIAYAGATTIGLGDAYTAFLDKYKAEFGEAPPGGFAGFGYDSVVITLDAIKRVAVTGDDGSTYIGRKALRDALYATKDLQGLTGKLNCSEYGDCATGHSIVMWEYVSGDPATFDPGNNPKIIYRMSN